MNADGTEACAVGQSHCHDSVLCYHSRTQLHRALLATFAGRALVAGLVLKALAFLIGLLSPGTAWGGAVDTLGDICLIGGGIVTVIRVSRIIRTRFLWRVRRKLILSYVFIGVVPALLIITFFLLAGLMMLFSVSSYLIQSRVRALVDETSFIAQKAASEYASAVGRGEGTGWRQRIDRQTGPYPGTSYSVLHGGHCGDRDASTSRTVDAVPVWVPCTGFAGLVQTVAGGALIVRALAPSVEPAGEWVAVDVPITQAVTHRLRDETGIDLGEITTVRGDEAAAVPAAPSTNLQGLRWVTFLDYTDWGTGQPGTATAALQLSVADVYDRISATPIAPIGNMNFGQLLLLGLALVGASFLVIQVVAFGMGIGLARSITGSIHELFAGTERVQRGDFTQRIAIRSRDQLGELAESFNSMTSSIEDLLRQKAVKERLEQELLIAREIQMSLLPQGPLRIPGFAVSGHCEPAREVGGDYFDLLPLPDGGTGVLIADVAGKGTSAALYMAELKGLVLSLSQQHRSPRRLLIEANRLIAEHLDDRSFITMTYAVVDPQAATLTYARAGHCPLIYRRTSASATRRRTQVLTPEGLVVGLKLDGGAAFERLLEEVTLPLDAGDLFVLFTDGLTEAMNAEGDIFGDERLAAIVDEQGDAPPAALRDQILREVHGFAGAAPQHDDMTILIMKVVADLQVHPASSAGADLHDRQGAPS